jgi:hypothetical protein
VSGTARRAHCPEARAPPGCCPVSWRSAASSVRWRVSGAGAGAVDHGVTHGLRICLPATSPSTMTASIGASA